MSTETKISDTCTTLAEDSKDEITLTDSWVNAKNIYQCGKCYNYIEGERYRCLHSSCKNFDLCATCVNSSFEPHIPDHCFQQHFGRKNNTDLDEILL